jgi:uncharacterized protein YjbI with pentapeptide repeats
MKKRKKDKVSKEYRQTEWFRRWRTGQMRSYFLILKRSLSPDSNHPLVNNLFDFRGVNFRKEKLRKINLNNSCLDEADFSAAYLNNGCFVNSQFCNAYFQGTKLCHVDFSNAVIVNAKFDGANLRKANFTNTVLRGSSFGNANMQEAILEGADITDCNFKNVQNLRSIIGKPASIDGLSLFYNDLIDAENSFWGNMLEQNVDNIRLDHKFDIAISFAGEDRDIARQIAEEIKSRGKRVFFDEYVKGELWGKDLYVHLINVYRKYAKYCLMIISEAYAKKNWTNHERKAAQARAFEENQEYILPLKLDDTPIPGLLSTIGYLRMKDTSINEIVGLLMQKLE